MSSLLNSSSEPSVELCGYPSVLAMVCSWFFLSLLLLPLFFYVLYVSHRQRKTAQSHSDVFTFHNINMEMLTAMGSLLYFTGGEHKSHPALTLGSSFYAIGITGQILIHALTCVERYLAVVYPITYLHLKKRGGVMIRNISIAAVWLLSSVIICLRYCHYDDLTYIILCMFTSTCFGVAVVAFCSVSVLYVLIRPGPGEGATDLKRIDQSKRRAFQTMLAIIVVLILRFIFLIVTYFLWMPDFLDHRESCIVMVSAGYFIFPSSLLLPLLFLHKAGKLQEALLFPCSRARERIFQHKVLGQEVTKH